MCTGDIFDFLKLNNSNEKKKKYWNVPAGYEVHFNTDLLVRLFAITDVLM